MTIKISMAFVLFVHLSFNASAQTTTTVNDLISKQKSGKDHIKYTDSTNGYSVSIPIWWEIKETPSSNFFGGTFPEINQSSSALLFKSFEKEKFKTLENFEKWVITGYKSGDAPKWSNQNKILFIKNLSAFTTIGKSFTVQLKSDDTFYNSCYIIVETSKAFLWIDLTSTRETYDMNFQKFEKLIPQLTTF